MFFQVLEDGIREVTAEAIEGDRLTLAYVKVEELEILNERLGFDESTVAACRNANSSFRSGMEVYGDYTFTELRIMNLHEDNDDYIALFLKKNLILVVDIVDYDGSTREKFLAAVHRYPSGRIGIEKVLASFLDSLVNKDQSLLEAIENELEQREDELMEKEFRKNLDTDLLRTKRILSQRHNYYGQLMDIADAVYENDNEIFDEKNLNYIDNISRKLERLQNETGTLRSTAEHLQDAYSAYLDMKMNVTMKILTVLTSIFFPLTIIVGWYGMNFKNMPELDWNYGYLYVILLSVVTVLIMALIGKRKKWF